MVSITDNGACVVPTSTPTMTSTPTQTPSVSPTNTPTSSQTPTYTPTQTPTETPPETFDYYNATQYLNCVQNSAVGAYKIKVPHSLSGYTWWCGDDGYQYSFDSTITGPTYDITAIQGAISCIALPC